MIGFLKALRGLLILLALLLAVVPMAMLISLLTGGSGYGLCPYGVSDCESTFLTGPTVAARIFAGLVILAAGIRVASRTIDRIERRRRRSESSTRDRLVGWTERLR